MTVAESYAARVPALREKYRFLPLDVVVAGVMKDTGLSRLEVATKVVEIMSPIDAAGGLVVARFMQELYIVPEETE